MKNIDFKKLLVLLGIILVVGLVIFGIVKLTSNKKGASEEEVKILEDIGLTYVARVTEGYTSNYNGIDLLYGNEKEITYEELSTAAVLNLATKYINNKELENSVPSSAVAEAKNMLGSEVDSYSPYNGEAIRQAIKELFGVDFANTSAVGETSFGYNFYYVPEYDIYLKGINNTYFDYNYDNDLKFYTVKTKKNKKENTIQIEYAVAYTRVNEDKKRDFATDVNGENIVATLEKEEKFPEDKVKEFEKYTITLKKDGDNYVFESFKKGSIK